MAKRGFCEIGCDAGTDKCVKGHGYHAHYERHLGHLREAPLTLVEIGIDRGASIRLWEEYLGGARVFGIDVNPACAKVPFARGRAFIGDQGDAAFLGRVVAETGALDVVVDDGGHHMDQQRASFLTLFPHLRPGGLYVVEDLHTSYSPSWGGAEPGAPHTGIALMKALVDDLNRRHHRGAPVAPGPVSEVHFYPSIAFILKG